jgi:DNA repair exonuclease SbcCD ATPase subunit
MQLLSARLINIRSFADVEIDFAPGFVRIAGENGAGKTTIVSGIAFALLGAESVESRRVSAPDAGADHVELDASSRLLRRGAPWGLAAVTFKVGEKTYRCHRVIGKRPKPRGKTDPFETEDAALVLLDPLGKAETLETKKGAIAGAVARLLDLPEDAFVHAWKRIVAAPQGKLLQAIFEENKERRNIYWRILGVDRYASAAADATRVGALLEQSYVQRLDRAVAAAGQEVKDLEGAPELAKSLEGEVATREGAVTERRSARENAARDRERATDGAARAREREGTARRLVVERTEVERERTLAEASLTLAEQAGRDLEAVLPRAARLAALTGEQANRDEALAAFGRARAAVEQARSRAAELGARDAFDARRLAGELAAALAAEKALKDELAALEQSVARSGAEAAPLAQAAKTAALAREELVRFRARFEPPLGRLLASLEHKASANALLALEDLARNAPAAEDVRDTGLLAGAQAITDDVTAKTAALASAHAVLGKTEDLAEKVGEGALCPFLAVSCPHPKGANLLETVNGNVAREKKAVTAAKKALDSALAARKRLDAARERVERVRAEQRQWSGNVAKTAPVCAAWLEAWDRERAQLGHAAAEAPAAVRELVRGLAVRVTAPRPIGQGRLFDSTGATAETGRDVLHPGTDWDAPSLANLARVVRARRSELEGGLPKNLEQKIEATDERITEDAKKAQARSDESARSLENLRGKLEAAPARLAAQTAIVSRLKADELAQRERHAKDAASRAADLAASERALAALAAVPTEHARFQAELETARRADAESHRLRGIAAQAAPARERVDLARARSASLEERARAAGLTAEDALARGALEGLAAALEAARRAADAALDAARSKDDAAATALLESERDLALLEHRLAEARSKSVALEAARARLEKLRGARDHVAHACSVLRGGAPAGKLSGLLYKALAELPGRLAERRVREVSRHARRMYRAIAPQETWDLVWDPQTYMLALGAPGTSAHAALREGIAIDDMSGGQQMSAALALHLALVHTYARSCDVLFLDEPTTHLDARRRHALAETLRSLRSRLPDEKSALIPLRQVFLISHDDAFEGLQDQVIRVVAGEAGAPSEIAGASVPAPRPPALEVESPPVALAKPRRPKKATAG